MEMQFVAWVAAIMVFLSFFMKTIVPLRTIAIGSNVVFIAYALLGLHYGVFDKVLPIFVLHLLLLPLNILRLRQVKQTMREVKRLANGRPSLEFLIPYTNQLAIPKGQTIFRRGDKAEEVFLIKSGTVEFPELGKSIGAGEIFGEIGVFAEDAKRTASAVCKEDCEFYSISGDKVIELFYQQPQFGFFIARALSSYLTNGGKAAGG
ncbi:MAG: cyclic nucleotide-binding domain-containing protein [Betaproteobacteria bacterium]